MPTFMSNQTFESLSDIQRRLAQGNLFSPTGQPGSVFVPWAGSRLKEKGCGIYYVGIAEMAKSPEDDNSFDGRLQSTEVFCRNGLGALAHVPFWNFLDGLTGELLHGRCYDTIEQWGWSNLMKIHWSEGPPGHWPPGLVTAQRDACHAAIKEEIGYLRNSLIFVASNDEYGIIRPTFGDELEWNKQDEAETSFWWRIDPTGGNLLIHSCHPKSLRLRHLFAPALKKTVNMARELLPNTFA